ncbi:hypothetical protein NITMOv2_0546 [Nitrospira moscoviensis]|uniref:Uncharacterized protein n=1 Tax=Nitrospira moscoviensis TaxID=42253 RepID=A0A0K2G8R4_NITMO|nr:hypothetical protein NITMOv2_0546 [Nitrospira moscoviensis]
MTSDSVSQLADLRRLFTRDAGSLPGEEWHGQIIFLPL